MHSGRLESTQEARVALGYRLVQLLRIFRALQTSRMHHIHFSITEIFLKILVEISFPANSRKQRNFIAVDLIEASFTRTIKIVFCFYRSPDSLSYPRF